MGKMVGRMQPLGRHLNFTLAQFGERCGGIGGWFFKKVHLVWIRVFA